MTGGSWHDRYSLRGLAWPSAPGADGPGGRGATGWARARKPRKTTSPNASERGVRQGVTAVAQRTRRPRNAAALFEIDDVIDPAETRWPDRCHPCPRPASARNPVGEAIRRQSGSDADVRVNLCASRDRIRCPRTRLAAGVATTRSSTWSPGNAGTAAVAEQHDVDVTSAEGDHWPSAHRSGGHRPRGSAGARRRRLHAPGHRLFLAYPGTPPGSRDPRSPKT